MKASVTILKFISQQMIEYTNSNFTDDFDVIYVNDKFYLEEVENATFSEFKLPRQNDYLFVIEGDFNFINDNFICSNTKAGAIESKVETHVLIDICNFVSCTVKSEYENGGEINFINCGMKCVRSDFIDCTSTTDGKGGRIYIQINMKIR